MAQTETLSSEALQFVHDKKFSKEQGSKSEKGEVSGKSGKMWDGGPVAYEGECQVRTKKPPAEWKHEHKSLVFRFINAKFTMMVIHDIITRNTVAMKTFFFFGGSFYCVNIKCEKNQNTDGGNDGLKSKYSETENVAH